MHRQFGAGKFLKCRILLAIFTLGSTFTFSRICSPQMSSALWRRYTVCQRGCNKPTHEYQGGVFFVATFTEVKKNEGEFHIFSIQVTRAVTTLTTPLHSASTSVCVWGCSKEDHTDRFEVRQHNRRCSADYWWFCCSVQEPEDFRLQAPLFAAIHQH